MDDGEKIAKAAMEYLGTPHMNMQKVKGRGIDCGMLLIASLEDAGLVKKGSIKIKPYSGEWALHHSEEWFLHYVEEYCEKVPQDDMKPGDFLLYQYGRCISHGGVYVGNNTICHACIDFGVILSDLNDVQFLGPHGKSRLRGVYRYKGVK